jgi:hypothetical protein
MHVRRALPIALLAAALAAPFAGAHNDLPRGQVMLQGVQVTEVGYALAAPLPGLPVPVLSDDYAALVSEAGHGAQASAFALGPSVLPSKTAPRPSDPVWAHGECTPQAAPLVAQWTVNVREASSGLLLLSSTSPGSSHALAGSFVDAWPLTFAGLPVGTAWVKYNVTLFIIGGSIC